MSRSAPPYAALADALEAAHGLGAALHPVVASGRLSRDEERAIAGNVLRLCEALFALSRELGVADEPTAGGRP